MSKGTYLGSRIPPSSVFDLPPNCDYAYRKHNFLVYCDHNLGCQNDPDAKKCGHVEEG